MPSPAHETLLVLLREHPAWLGTLMSVLAGRKLPDGLTPIDATVRLVDPAEVRPDLAFVVPAKSRAQPESWVLLESQLDKDEKKRLSWPLAVTAVWNERGPGDLDQVPEPELRTRLVRSIMDVLNEKMIEGLKELVMNQGNEFPRNPALRKLADEWAARFGPELEARGEAKGEAKALLQIAALRGLELDEASRARVLACQDLGQLERWIQRALTAESALELFQSAETS